MSAIKFALNHLTLGVLWGATVLLGMAPSVQATPPVTNGLVLHMDAAQVTGTASGAQLDTWSDASGLANHAYRQSESSTGYPQYVASVVNGQPVVRFNSVSANIGDYYRFDRITTIRSVFWVLKENAGVSDGRFLLGDSDFSNYHFHRSYANGPLWDGGYSSANVRNGMTKLMGTPINGTTTSLPSGSFQLVSLVTAGDVSANQISQDRTSHGSWQGDIAEILIYNRPLTSTEENEVGAYLAAKYALSTAYVTPVTPAVPTGVAAAPVSSGAIRVSWLGVSGATKYNLSYKTTIGGSEQVVTAISASPFVVSGLSNGSSYDFKVAAVNSAGTSAYSSVVSATPVVSGAKDILAVVFPSQPAATISGTSVSVTVASATDVTSLSPTYTLSANATGSPASGTPRNFTTPQTYTITAEDNSTKVYTMTVSVMPDTLPPITSGLVLRMDASKITGKVNGTQLNTWVNTSGVPNDAIRQSGSSVGFPKYVTGVLNGKPVVRFNSADATGDSFDFSRISNIRSVFWVLKENAGLSDGHFLLGDDSSYQFHRGDSNGALWANNYSDNHIKNGVTRLMGNAIDGTSVSLPSGSFQLVSLVTDGDVQANRICQDRTAHGSWQGDIAEILIYDRALTGAEELQVGSYLSTKYALSTAYPVLVPPLTPTGIAATPVSSGMVSVSWLAVSGATSYNVSYKTTIGGTQQVMNGVSASPTIITGLTDGTLYDFKVMAINAVGASDYSEVVTATPKQSSAKDILSAAFGPLGPATLTGTEVKITVAPNVSVTALAPTFTISPLASISPASGTVRDFTNPQSYTVTAQDSSIRTYTVIVQSYNTWTNSASFFILTTPEGANIPSGAVETNFPVLLRLNSNSFNFGQAQTDGGDIRFTTLAGTPLSYQIEQWDAAAGTAAIWIKIPSISANARQEVKMYWGKTGVTSESNGLNVFNADNGYASVIHLDDTLGDVVGNVTPTNIGTTSTSGIIGKGRYFNGGQGINYGTNITTLPSGSSSHTTQAWFKASAAPGLVVAWGVDEPQGKLLVQFSSPPRITVGTYFSGGDVVGASSLATSQWIHVAHTYVNGQANLYLNGVLDGTTNGGTPMNISNPARMYIGGFYDNYDFVGAIDEVRISKVARSANWIKMEYENQKFQQTLVGNLVQAGSAFTATPSSLTINEGATATLTGQAGGAQKVYWIEKRNGVDTVLATDTFTLPVIAGRVSSNQSYVIQFKAIYASSVQTADIPITIIENLPDPIFTLTGPSTWDGRQPITVTPIISNLGSLQAKGVANLTYSWSVGGVATTKTTTPGTPTVPGVMNLTRSQGSGPMIITLVLNNGGALVTATKTITVTEPATDAWVQRTPAADEIPVTGQFYARDDSGMGKLYYNGTQSGSATAVFLKVYTTDGGDVLYATHRQSLVAGNYAFTAPLTAGRVTYKVDYGTTIGGVDTVVNSVTNLVCGDAYLFDGQSNALATDSLPYDGTTDPWVRTYDGSSGWGNAVRNGSEYTVGYFAFDLALSLTKAQDMPICIINGAVGGTRIDQHQANPADHTVEGSSYSIYANLLNRVLGAKLTHGIRGAFWHQGESDSGAGAPTGEYDYKSYQSYFVEMAAAWKQDFPNLGRYIIFQVMPAPCSLGPKGDQLRDVQRTLPLLYSKMDILNTLAIPGYIGCHFTAEGYQNVADRTLSLAKQRYYGFMPGASYTAPVLRRAYFTSAARTAINLVFDQPMSWSSFSPPNYYVDKVANKVTSGSASGNVVTLQLNSAAATTATLDYLQDVNWYFGEASSSLLFGANGIPALTFADVTIEPASQTISFGALPTKTFGNAPFALTATASSGLAVSYLSSDPLVASISGNTVTLLKAGSTTITASQAGNASYSAATPVAQLLTVNNAATTTTLSTSGTPSTFGSRVTLTATVAPSMSGGTVQFFDNALALGSPVALSVGKAQFFTSVLATGSHTITATYSGNTNYNGSTASALTQTVNPGAYNSWAADPAQGLTAGVNDRPLDDSDHDGIANLLEFVLGGKPTVSSQAILPTLTKTAGAWVFKYQRSDSSMAPATTQVVEYGNDLIGWTPVVIPSTSYGLVTITDHSPSDTVEVTIPIVGPQIFVRLKVTQ